MSTSWFDSPEEEDRFWLVMLIPIVILGGFFLPVIEAVRVWLVAQHILVTEQILLPLPGGAGLDAPRVLILAGLIIAGLLLLIKLTINRVRRRRRIRLLEGEAS